MSFRKILPILILSICLLFVNNVYSLDVFKYILDYNKLNIKPGTWIVLKFPNASFINPDLSNIRVECNNCSYYLYNDYELLINNSANIYITIENNYTKNQNLPTFLFEQMLNKSVFSVGNYITNLRSLTTQVGQESNKTSYVGDYLKIWGSDYYLDNPDSTSKNYYIYFCSDYMGTSIYTGSNNPPEEWMYIKIYPYKKPICIYINKIYVYTDDYEDSAHIDMPGISLSVSKGSANKDINDYLCFYKEYVFFLNKKTYSNYVYISLYSSFYKALAQIYYGGNGGSIYELKIKNIFPIIKLNLTNLIPIEPIYIFGYEKINKILGGLKLTYVNNTSEILNNLKFYTYVDLNVYDYKTKKLLKTYKLNLSKINLITVNITNYPLITKVFNFSTIKFILANTTPTINLMLPSLDLARILRIKILPQSTDYYVELYKNSEPKGVVDIERTDPNSIVYFFVPQSDLWTLKIYNNDGNILYSYTGLLTSSDYQITIDSNTSTTTSYNPINLEISINNTNCIEQYPKWLNESIEFKINDICNLTKVEVFYLNEKGIFKYLNITNPPKILKINIDDKALNSSIKWWFVFTFNNSGEIKTIWIYYKTGSLEVPQIFNINNVKDDILKTILLLFAFVSAGLLIYFTTKSTLSETLQISIIAVAVPLIFWFFNILSLQQLILISILTFLAGFGLIRYKT